MKRAILSALAMVVAVWAALVLIQKCSRDPEVTNTADTERPSEGIELGPAFFVSDPTLLVPQGIAVEERAIDKASGRGLADAPYFIQFSDGRYAYGYADDQGRTRSLYASQSVAHEVFWYDDAWAKRNALSQRPREAGEQGVAADGAAPRR